jgi:hypothetical protein
MVGELLLTAAFNCTMSLILLFATRRARSLNRSMIWVLAGGAVLHLLNTPLPMMGMEPFYSDSFFFYNKSELNGWFFTTGLLFKAVSSIVGILLYLYWERCRNHGISDHISDDVRMEVTKNFCINELQAGDNEHAKKSFGE